VKTKIQFTRLGKVFAGIAVFFYLAAMTSQSMLLLALLGLIAGIFIANGILARQMLLGVELKGPRKCLLPEGGKLEAPWEVINRSGREVQMITCETGGERLFAVDQLAPGDACWKIPEIRLLKRGVYPHREVRLACAFPFGLLVAARQQSLAGEALVHPAIYETTAPIAGGFEGASGGKFRGKGRTAFGSDFAGARPWVAGDPVKQIDWKSSSKGRGLMVKTFEEELSGKVSLLIYLKAGEPSHAMDDALRAAGSLMFATLDAGHQLEWCLLHEGTMRKTAPYSDGSEILEDLARAEPPEAEATEEAWNQTAKQLSRRSALVVVATSADRKALEWIQNQGSGGRRTCLYLPKQSLAAGAEGLEIRGYDQDSISDFIIHGEPPGMVAAS
jgi:uncharacterized protein (DUF58 family)